MNDFSSSSTEIECDTNPLIPIRRGTEYRWLVLFLYSFFCVLHNAMWDTWGPISLSATQVIGFTDHDYALLSNWEPIGVMVSMPFYIWLMNEKGLRLPTVIGSIFMEIGAGLRCLPLQGVPLKYAIHVGQLFNALAGNVALGAATLISNTWFPANERILATSIMMCFGNIGDALSFVIGPAIVNNPNNCSQSPNATAVGPPLNFEHRTTPSYPQTTACTNNLEQMRNQINYYLYGEFGFAVGLFLLILFFFRNEPTLPPSATAATERLDILAGLKALSKNYSYWTLTISYSLVNGAYFGWYGISTVLLTPHGLSDNQVGNAAFTMTVVATVVGIVLGWFGDKMKGRLKWILLTCYCLMFISFLYLVIMIMGWITVKPFIFTDAGFWVSYIIFGAFGNAILSIGMEMVADVAYPVNEGTSTTITIWVTMLFMFIYLLVLSAVSDQDIAHFLLLAFIGVATPVLAVTTKNRNVRLELDKNDNEAIQSNSESKTPTN